MQKKHQNLQTPDFNKKNNTSTKKSRRRETKHLSTDADSSTDTKVGWTKNTQKPNFFGKQTKNIQHAKTQNV